MRPIALFFGLSLGLNDRHEEAKGDACRSLADRVGAYERRLIVEALAANNGSRTETADALGVGRKTLYEKMKKYDIE